VPNARYAAEQFAYLVAGAPLDRAVLVGSIPPRNRVIASAREGVQTFSLDTEWRAAIAGERNDNAPATQRQRPAATTPSWGYIRQDPASAPRVDFVLTLFVSIGSDFSSTR
jgi:hypothetical protein